MIQYTNEIEAKELNFDYDKILEDWIFIRVECERTDAWKRFASLNGVIQDEIKTVVCCPYVDRHTRLYAIPAKSRMEEKLCGVIAESGDLPFVLMSGQMLKKTSKCVLLRFCLLSLIKTRGVHTRLYIATSVYKGQHDEYVTNYVDIAGSSTLIIKNETKTMTGLSELTWDVGEKEGDWERVTEIYRRYQNVFIRDFTADKDVLLKEKKLKGYYAPIKPNYRTGHHKTPVLDTGKILPDEGRVSSKMYVLDSVLSGLYENGYVKRIPFKKKEVARYGDDDAYKALSKSVAAYYSKKTLHLVMGEDVKDKDHTMDAIAGAISALQKSGSLPNDMKAVFTRPEEVPKEEPCLYIIEENRQDPKNETQSDLLYQKRPSRITQYVVGSRFSEEKGSQTIIEACLNELFCKHHIESGTAPIILPEGVKFLYYEKVETEEKGKPLALWKCEHEGGTIKISKAEDTWSDPFARMFEMNSDDDKNTPKLFYLIVRKEGASESILTVYNTDTYAIADMDMFHGIVTEIQVKTNGHVRKKDLKEYIRAAGEFVEKKDNRTEEYLEKIEEYADGDQVPLSALSGRACNYRKALSDVIFDKEGYKLIKSGLKRKEDIDKLYPAYSKITYSEAEDGKSGSYFVMNGQNPLLGMKNIDDNVLERKYIVNAGSNFIQEVFETMYVPFVSFKQISVRPYYSKFIREYRLMKNSAVSE